MVIRIKCLYAYMNCFLSCNSFLALHAHVLGDNFKSFIAVRLYEHCGRQIFLSVVNIYIKTVKNFYANKSSLP